jgi:hypothetical protein
MSHSTFTKKDSITLDHRKHIRHAVEYTGSFLGEGLTASGLILNLSEAGCRSRSEGIIKLGALLQVLIDLPRYQTPLQVSLAMVPRVLSKPNSLCLSR